MGMNESNVPSYAGLYGSFEFAMQAGEGLAARMDSIVSLQIRFAKEALFAHGALEGPHAVAVRTQRMHVQTISGADFRWL